MEHKKELIAIIQNALFEYSSRIVTDGSPSKDLVEAIADDIIEKFNLNQ